MDYTVPGNYQSCNPNTCFLSSAADKHTLPIVVFRFHTVLAVRGMKDQAAMVGHIRYCTKDLSTLSDVLRYYTTIGLVLQLQSHCINAEAGTAE